MSEELIICKAEDTKMYKNPVPSAEHIHVGREEDSVNTRYKELHVRGLWKRRSRKIVYLATCAVSKTGLLHPCNLVLTLHDVPREKGKHV